ncbi:GMP/IMP nucleotidase [Shewanella inventionis]|uniref:Nucleotidase n=1 Tax=Shewanella inventionis TaxID=1738770 RepID=A0ABQ1JQ05_9GAMM|nr:GMP/IMP nucleotidase [Shewanella inventionis]MCL1159115.1 GMP/IMP nucleotidase [Shewanella inventionis]UAL43819.1 GMP/IMP nucleotidase [Shewanella inventionis]GGB71703.1 nucleotidase [Shewanella inventionis]
MFPWHKIDTVLLDMDGTLLDLHFDNHFWLQLVPQQLSQLRQISLADANDLVTQAYHNVVGTLDWYCLDYWQQHLGLDILALHHTAADKIKIRQDSMPFLEALAGASKRRILFTNAHPHSLALKLTHTNLAEGLDELLSSHESGYPKEHPEFWHYAFDKFNLTPQRCLFIDDSEVILAASKRAGVGYQLGVSNPDSKKPHTVFKQFPAVSDLLHSL